MARRTFEPVGESGQLFRFDDCCGVYLLKHGQGGVLIDLGSGAALDHLHGVGVDELEGVFFTHAHRDQCQGAAKAAAEQIPLHFPQASRALVHPEERRDLQPPSPLVGLYPGRFEQPPPLDGARFDARPDTRIPWGGGDLEVIAVPGHSPDQVAYLADLKEVRVAFCGDAFHSPGKIHEPYHLETDHYTGAGCRQAVEGLRVLRNARPSALCPAHGPITMGDVWRGLDETILALLHLAELKDTNCPRRPAVARLLPPHSQRLMQLSPHLLVWNNSYLLLSDDGPVLMVDCGEPVNQSFHAQWREQIGPRPVEVVLVTHIHCDHVDGISALRAAGGILGISPQGDEGSVPSPPQVWALASLAPLLAQPHAYRRPFLPREAVSIDRPLADLAEFEWREYVLHAYESPGQTDLHALYATAVDGKKVVFSGDNFYPPQQWGGTGGLSGLNGGHPLRGWRGSIELMLMLEPDWVLASHVQPFPYRRADFEAMLGWSEAVADAMRALAPDGCLERHHDPHLIELFPYCQRLQGDAARVTARVQNPYPNPIQADLALVLPPGWGLERAHRRLTVAAGAVGATSWTPRWTGPAPPAAAMLTLDVVYEGEYLGQKAECYVYR